MRIAVLPMYTISNLKGASEMYAFKGLLDKINKMSENLFCYYAIPIELLKESTPLKDGMYIGADSRNYLFYDQEGSAPISFLDMFNERIGRYPIDVVWTNRTSGVPLLARMLRDSRSNESTIPIFIEEFKALDKGVSAYKTGPNDLILHSLGYYFGYGIFDHSEEKRLAMSAARRYCAASVIKQIDERSRVFNHNIDTDRIDYFKSRIEKNKTFTLFFGGRLNIMKRADRMLAIYDMFYKFGRKIKIIVTSPRAESKLNCKAIIKDKFPEIEFIFNCQREKFLSSAISSHIALFTSHDEGFSLGTLETIYCGCVTILPRLGWVVNGILEGADYPFLYNNWTEAQALLRYAYENYEECNRKMEAVREYIRKRYGTHSKNFGEVRIKYMQEVLKGREKKVAFIKGKQMVELLDDTLQNIDEAFSLDEFYDLMISKSRAYSKSQKRSPNLGMITRYGVYKWLKKKGLKDTCEKPLPTYKK